MIVDDGADAEAVARNIKAILVVYININYNIDFFLSTIRMTLFKSYLQ